MIPQRAAGVGRSFGGLVVNLWLSLPTAPAVLLMPGHCLDLMQHLFPESFLPAQCSHCVVSPQPVESRHQYLFALPSLGLRTKQHPQSQPLQTMPVYPIQVSEGMTDFFHFTFPWLCTIKSLGLPEQEKGAESWEPWEHQPSL